MDFDPEFANNLYARPRESLHLLDDAAERAQVREAANLTAKSCPLPLFPDTLFCPVEGYDQGVG